MPDKQDGTDAVWRDAGRWAQGPRGGAASDRRGRGVGGTGKPAPDAGGAQGSPVSAYLALGGGGAGGRAPSRVAASATQARGGTRTAHGVSGDLPACIVPAAPAKAAPARDVAETWCRRAAAAHAGAHLGVHGAQPGLTSPCHLQTARHTQMHTPPHRPPSPRLSQLLPRGRRPKPVGTEAHWFHGASCGPAQTHPPPGPNSPPWGPLLRFFLAGTRGQGTASWSPPMG